MHESSLQKDNGLVKMFLATTLLLLLPGAVLGQTAPPPARSDQSVTSDQPITTLKVTTRVVAISAVVRSKDGEFKGGLTKDDFILKQDGKEASIRYFSQGSELPLTLALMVDTSGSQRTFIGDESLASDVFFETMLGDKRDRAMLVQFDNSVVQLRGLTPSANALHLALLRMSAHAASAGGTLLNDAVYTVAKNSLAGETGRKAMVILSDGGDNGSRRSVAEAIEQAQRADVQIYCILYSEAQASAGMTGRRLATQDTGLEILEKLSESTGGQVFTVSPTLGLRQIYAQIGRSLRLQYELGYTPPPDLQPNVYHKLELRAKDKKLSVQARKGFFGQP
jgi:Ca-activated chloride channel family protein